MLVLDASVIAEFLIDSSAGRRASELILAAPRLHVPHHAIVETVSVLRGWGRGGLVPTARLDGALADLADLDATRWQAEHLLPRIWELRHNMTSYDAGYVALAEAIGAPLLTADHRLARAARDAASCHIEEISATTGR